MESDQEAIARDAVLCRSMVLAPATDMEAVERASSSCPDVLCLDLEDTVPASQKPRARAIVRDAVQAHSAMPLVQVRINPDWEEVVLDLEACVWPGLNAVRLPKVENPEQVQRVVQQLERLEAERGVPPVAVSVLVETVVGLFASRQIASASRRLQAISLGHEDFARDLGVEPTTDGDEALLAQLGLVLVAKEAGLVALGSLGRVSGNDAVRQRADWLAGIGYLGAATTNPELVGTLNDAFSPSEADVRRAEEIVAAFDEAVLDGRGALTHEVYGFIDQPVAMRARGLLLRAARVATARVRGPGGA